jgi:hypothetical protein
VDLGTVEVDWLLTNANGPIYKGALIPGDLVTTTGRHYRFSDRGARTGNGKRFGIYSVKFNKLHNGSGFSYTLQAYGNLKGATDANMSVQVYVGDATFAVSKQWTQTPTGWRMPKDH